MEAEIVCFFPPETVWCIMFSRYVCLLWPFLILTGQEDDGLGGAQGQDGFFLEEVLPGGDDGNGTMPRGRGDKEDSGPEGKCGVWNSYDQEDEVLFATTAHLIGQLLLQYT